MDKSKCSDAHKQTHIDSDSLTKLQADTLQVEQNPKRQLKDFLLETYVLFMRVSGDPGSGK